MREFRNWIEALIGAAPGGVGRRLRSAWWRGRLSSVGKAPSFGPGLEVGGARNIALGDRFTIGRNGLLHAENGSIRIGNNASFNCNVFVGASEGGTIEIGNDVLIGPNVVLRASDHAFGDVTRPVREQGHTGKRISLGDDVWIGANAVIVGGVAVGAHSIIAAGAVVTRDVEPWTIAGGVPAKEIGRRK